MLRIFIDKNCFLELNIIEVKSSISPLQHCSHIQLQEGLKVTIPIKKLPTTRNSEFIEVLKKAVGKIATVSEFCWKKKNYSGKINYFKKRAFILKIT